MPWVRYRTTRSRGHSAANPVKAGTVVAATRSERPFSAVEDHVATQDRLPVGPGSLPLLRFRVSEVGSNRAVARENRTQREVNRAAVGTFGPYALENYAYALVNWRVCSGKHAWKNMNKTNGRCHVNHRVTSLWAPTPEIMQRSSLAATVSSRRRGIGGVFGGRPDGVGR